MFVRLIVFLSSANLICRSTDISKCFIESLGVRDNESRLYLGILAQKLHSKKKRLTYRKRFSKYPFYYYLFYVNFCLLIIFVVFVLSCLFSVLLLWKKGTVCFVVSVGFQFVLVYFLFCFLLEMHIYIHVSSLILSHIFAWCLQK